jgi:hypothetical protein
MVALGDVRGRRASSAYAAAAGRSPPSPCRWPTATAAEHRGRILAHRVVGEGDEVVVPGEDLRPVGLLGACRVVVQAAMAASTL